MRWGDLAKAMATVCGPFDCLVNTRERSSGLGTIVDMVGRFNGRDVTSYLEAYKAEILMPDILEDRRLSRLPQVVTLSIQTEVLEMQADYHN